MSLEHKHAILDALLTVLDERHAHAVIEHRRFTIKKPLTVYAAERLAGKLAEWGDANEAADIMIDRCWQGFNADWVRDRARPTGKRTIIEAAMDRLQRAETAH